MDELAQQIRSIVGVHWARRLSEYRDRVHVPDQNGCLERTRKEGGTLAHRPQNRFSERSWLLRRAAAKTKGKIRVVTMQSSKVKEVLTPVHECLYDFLSSKRWLVRGEITKKHIRAVVDGRVGNEDFISGDYQSATDNIYQQVPFAIAEILADSPFLTSLEREALLESFRPENMKWVSSAGRVRPIRRGSMMGNLMSFPMLCLLNKACYNITCALRRKRDGTKRLENAIVNGDDIAFAGDQVFFEDWRAVTSHFGLVVNELKTGKSGCWVELNSRSFFVNNRGAIRALRKPVLSSLQPGDNPSCLLTRLCEGMLTLSPGVFRWLLIMLRHNVIRTGVSLASVPCRLRRVLVKMRWFRQALLVEPVVREEGVMRSWPVSTKTFRPSKDLIPLYDWKCDALLRYGVSLVRGRKCPPYSRRLVGSPVLPSRDPHLSFFRSWVWRWPTPLLEWWVGFGFGVEELGRDDWVDDHSHLSVRVSVETQSRFPPVLDPGFILMNDSGHSFFVLSG